MTDFSYPLDKSFKTLTCDQWVDFRPVPELIPHSPEQYYISEPTFNYDPGADSTDCHRLLEALDPMERTIFLRTVAASLDLAAVRKRWGRLIKALLCVGDGSNGKDALRECVSSLHGKALTGCSLKDFSGYDGGRKFPIARLAASRVNWSSENILHGKLDTVQSLKAAITGEPLSCEPKGKDEEEFNPKSVFLFNCNEHPKVQGHQQAFVSRYGILNFKKTYKIGANTAAGELEADPRFKYDPEFLKSQVMPAFLNIVLTELDNLMAKGVDYTSVEKAMEEARSESNHLYQICQDVGLVATKGEEVLLKDVWEAIYREYLDKGFVEEETDKNGKVKKLWITDVDQGDPLVKGPNKLLAGLKRVFGNSLKTRVGTGGASYLVGVKFEQTASLPHSETLEPFTDNTFTPTETLDTILTLSSLTNQTASLIPELPNSQPTEPSTDNTFTPTETLEVSSLTASLTLEPSPNQEPSPPPKKLDVNTNFKTGDRVFVVVGGNSVGNGTFTGLTYRVNNKNFVAYNVLLDGKDQPWPFEKSDLNLIIQSEAVSEAVILTSEAVSEDNLT